MNKKNSCILLLGGLLLLLLTSCKCTQEQMDDLVVINDSPADGTLISSLLPSFAWHSESCSPSYYYLSVHANGNTSLLSASVQAPDDATSFDWVTPPLEPGKEYAWHVRPYLVDPGYASGPKSEETIFYTGPVCSGETLVAPDLQGPTWVEHNGPQEFNWIYPGSCLPISYDYQFSSDIGFTDLILSGTTTEPYAQHIVQTFPNCSSVFWRVAANDGTTVGPWSDVLQFHWVTDESCWQNHYISDDAARIQVRLYEDLCDMTGYSTPLNARIVEGCKRWKNSTLITAEGDFSDTVFSISDIRVDLGPGPCPSTGLDHKGTFDTFNVLTPGIYCVSISRNQSGQTAAGDVNLMKGIWVEPRTDEVLAYKTIELESGPQDLEVHFFWDRFEPVTLFYPVPENINCRRGPDIVCDPLKIPLAGEILPIIARDVESEWKQTSYEGELCYVYLPAVQIDEALAQTASSEFRTEDLPFFETQPSCPTPTPAPPEHQPTSPTGCAQYTDQRSCIAAKCNWFKVNDTTSLCIPY